MRKYNRLNSGVLQSKLFAELDSSRIPLETKGNNQPQPIYQPPSLVSDPVSNVYREVPEDEPYADLSDVSSSLEVRSSWGDPVPMRLRKGMTPGTATSLSFLSQRERNLLLGNYRDDSRDGSHYWEHLASRQE